MDPKEEGTQEGTDLRSALEAAVAEQEQQEVKQPEQKVEVQKTEPEQEEVKVEAVEEEAKIKPAPLPPEGDVAPKSWKATTRTKWATLDPEIKAEVRRRESEMTRAFGENAQARELHKNFYEAVRPFEARIRSMGGNPLHLVGELFKADHILSTAPPTQRAQYMAQLIKEYAVDIDELDSALAGTAPADPVAARVEQLLQQRMAPLQQFLAHQQQTEQQRQQEVQAQAQAEVESMAVDPKYPHFNDVREDMADIIDLAARRGIYLTPAQAYSKAVAMNPELGAQLASQQQAEQQRQQALKLNGKAQRALAASSSVASSPSGTPGSSGSGQSSLRDTIEASFNDVLGR